MDKRRFPRLSLTTEQFKLSDNGKVYAVTDLSKLGMAIRILNEDDLSLFPVMRPIEGVLKILSQKHPVRARIANIRKGNVGCEFIDLDPKVSGAIERFLDPVRLGPDLKPVELTEENAAWYHAASGTDVLVWRNDGGEIVRFGVYIFGSFVQWDSSSGLSTGRIAASADEESIPSGVIRLETMILDPDPSPCPGKVGVAKSLILSSNLAKELQNYLLLKMAGQEHGP